MQWCTSVSLPSGEASVTVTLLPPPKSSVAVPPPRSVTYLPDQAPPEAPPQARQNTRITQPQRIREIIDSPPCAECNHHRAGDRLLPCNSSRRSRCSSLR